MYAPAGGAVHESRSAVTTIVFVYRYTSAAYTQSSTVFPRPQKAIANHEAVIPTNERDDLMPSGVHEYEWVQRFHGSTPTHC